MAKIAKTTLKIYWMIQKILSCENFLKMVQNGSIRKVITKKTIFEDIFIFSPAVGHPGSTLRKFSEDLKKHIMILLSRLMYQIDLKLHTPNVFDPLNMF